MLHPCRHSRRPWRRRACHHSLHVILQARRIQATVADDHADLTFDICSIGDADLQMLSLEFTGLRRAAYSLVSPPILPLAVEALTARQTATVCFTPTASQSYDSAGLLPWL